MSQKEKINDPAAFFRQSYGEMEEGWSKLWEQLLSSPVYAQTMGALMDAYLSSQQAVQTNLKKYMESLNIPTKDDLARVAYQVVQAEQKISELQKEIKAMKSLEAKLDLVLAEVKEVKGYQKQHLQLAESLGDLEKKLAEIQALLTAKNSAQSQSRSSSKTGSQGSSKSQSPGKAKKQKEKVETGQRVLV